LRSKVESLANLAEGDLTRAIELAPQDPVIRFQRAVYYEFVQRWEDAIADHTRTIELAPDEAAFHFRRGAARWQASDDDEGWAPQLPTTIGRSSWTAMNPRCCGGAQTRTPTSAITARRSRI
jgi:tetratricopeptide (TPR) repeat protein